MMTKRSTAPLLIQSQELINELSKNVYVLVTEHDGYHGTVGDRRKLSRTLLVNNYLKPYLKYMSMRQKLLHLLNTTYVNQRLSSTMMGFLLVKRVSDSGGTKFVDDHFPYPEYVELCSDHSPIDQCLSNYLCFTRSLDSLLLVNDLPEDLLESIIDESQGHTHFKDVYSDQQRDPLWQQMYLSYLKSYVTEGVKKRVNLLSEDAGCRYRNLMKFPGEYCNQVLQSEYCIVIEQAGIIQEETTNLRNLWAKYLIVKQQQIRQFKLKFDAYVEQKGTIAAYNDSQKLKRLANGAKSYSSTILQEYGTVTNLCNYIGYNALQVVNESLDYLQIQILKTCQNSDENVIVPNHSRLLWILSANFPERITDLYYRLAEVGVAYKVFRSCVVDSFEECLAHIKSSLCSRVSTDPIIKLRNKWVIKLIQYLHDIQEILQYMQPETMEECLKRLQKAMTRSSKLCLREMKDHVQLHPDSLIPMLLFTARDENKSILKVVESTSLVCIGLDRERVQVHELIALSQSIRTLSRHVGEKIQFTHSKESRIYALSKAFDIAIKGFSIKGAFVDYIRKVTQVKLDLDLLTSNFTRYPQSSVISADLDSLKQWPAHESSLERLEGSSYSQLEYTAQVVRVALFIAFEFFKSFSTIPSIAYQKALRIAKHVLPDSTEERYENLVSIVTDEIALMSKKQSDGRLTDNILQPLHARSKFFADRTFLELISNRQLTPLLKQCLCGHVLEWLTIDQMVQIHFEEFTIERDGINQELAEKRNWSNCLLTNVYQRSHKFSQLIAPTLVTDLNPFFCFELIPWLVVQRQQLVDLCLIRKLLPRGTRQSPEVETNFILYLLIMIREKEGIPTWMTPIRDSISQNVSYDLQLCIQQMRNTLRMKSFYSSMLGQEILRFLGSNKVVSTN